jgi:hypothetical protein
MEPLARVVRESAGLNISAAKSGLIYLKRMVGATGLEPVTSCV